MNGKPRRIPLQQFVPLICPLEWARLLREVDGDLSVRPVLFDVESEDLS